MTKLKSIMATAAGALILGAVGYSAASKADGAPPSERIVVAAEDALPSADEGDAGSAKMGEGQGTHEGADQGATPENDTSKIDQPARRNPTTGNSSGDDGEAMPPNEEDDEAMPPDEDEAMPSDEGEDTDR
jgi:hypothetical protein